MRFMALLKADKDTKAGVLPSEELLATMSAPPRAQIAQRCPKRGDKSGASSQVPALRRARLGRPSRRACGRAEPMPVG